MSYGIKMNNRRDIKTENNDALVESWINGNRMYVRTKFKGMRHENKGIFLQRARETMSAEDYADLQEGLYK